MPPLIATELRRRRGWRVAAFFGCVVALLIELTLTLALPAIASATGIDARYPIVRKYFPNASQFGPIEGKPPAAAAYAGNKVIGYIIESKLVTPVTGFSGAPVDLLIAIDTAGKILGVKVLEQSEPELLVGDEVRHLYDFVARYVGRRATDTIVVGSNEGTSGIRIDAMSGATISSVAVNQTIMDAALKVALSRRSISEKAAEGAGRAVKIRMHYYEKADWKRLLENGGFWRLHLTRSDVAKAFPGMPPPLFPGDSRRVDPAEKAFIDLYYALIRPPSIGENLLGASLYRWLLKRLEPGEEAIAILANGPYSFKGVNYVRDGIFDRIRVVQGRTLIEFRPSDYEPLNGMRLSGMPAFSERAIFIIRKTFGFDPGRPWTLQLVVRRRIGPLRSVDASFGSTYDIPSAYIERAKPSVLGAASPLWLRTWYAARLDIAVLLAGLLLLTGILIFQDFFARRPSLLQHVRIGFLVFTVVFIGYWGQGQLSVVNIFAITNALIHGSGWSSFLLDPMICILWVFVAVAVLVIGRGAYCGWLCPFGALQELISKAAKRLRVPQLEFPWLVHKRLSALKYLILLFLFGLSLHSVYLAERYAEVEPFDTAIQLHFMRSWPFVLYAGFLLLIAAFNQKFYCRYVCPLGAGLAVAGRYRLLDRLPRRPQCGHPCRVCANECEVRAISPLGQINMNECHYCLDCHVTYWNEARCPPLAQRRKRLRPSSIVARPATVENPWTRRASRAHSRKLDGVGIKGRRDAELGT